jgi:hypothetical protein
MQSYGQVLRSDNWANKIAQNKTTQWLEVFKIYPKADFNDARYPITNQVRRAGSYPSRW